MSTSAARGLRTVLLVLVTILVPLAALEIGLRLFFPPNIAMPVSEYHPIYGFHNRPEARGYYRRRDYVCHVRIDSLGLRYREITRAKPAGTVRVLGLGDSFAFGQGVAADSCFYAVAERALDPDLRAALGESLQIVNTGVGSWSTAQEYLYLEHEGLGFAPDVVVLAFTVSNDFEDNRHADMVRVTPDSVIAVRVPETWLRRVQRWTAEMPGYAYVAQHSRLANLLRYHLTQVQHETKRRHPRGAETTQMSDTQRSASYVLTQRLVDEVVRTTRRARVRLVFLVIPDYAEVRRGGFQGQPGLFDPAPHRAMVAALETHLESLGVTVVDPLLELKQAAWREEQYFPSDHHMNAAGHAHVGYALAETLGRILDPSDAE